MKEFIEAFGLAFVPIFVAVDAIGVLPLFMGLTEDLTAAQRRKIIWESVATALVVAVGFAIGGSQLLKLIGVQVDDFMVAGGAILFVLATSDIIIGTKASRNGINHAVGAVPLGTPLIAGPAVLTSSLILVEQLGFIVTILALLVNIVLAGVVLESAGVLVRVLGNAGSKAVSKVASLILAAYAVMMIRHGVMLMGKSM